MFALVLEIWRFIFTTLQCRTNKKWALCDLSQKWNVYNYIINNFNNFKVHFLRQLTVFYHLFPTRFFKLWHFISQRYTCLLKCWSTIFVKLRTRQCTFNSYLIPKYLFILFIVSLKIDLSNLVSLFWLFELNWQHVLNQDAQNRRCDKSNISFVRTVL